MVRIGIAGGYGDVGRTLVEVLSQNPTHDVFIFSRKPIEGASAIRVDYDNVAKLHDVLEANSIEVVISCLNVMDEKTSQAQVNLAKAAIHSYSTKRFIVSQWSIEIPQSSPIPDFSAVTLAELEAAIGIEYTIVTNGHFSDYYGYPKVKSYLKHAGFLVDIRNKTAAIPGSGNDKVVFTYSFDVARFVDALISTCKEWPKRSVIIGDVITMNDLVKVAEEARGEKFVVHYDDSAKLNTFQVTELPSHLDAYKIFPKPQLQMMFTVFGQWITRGLFDIPYAGSLNEMFPHIKTRSVKQLIDEAWK